MKTDSSHKPSVAKVTVRPTATARLIPCICRRERMSPCIICPPSSGKTGNRLSNVHQQHISMRKKKKNMASGGNCCTDSIGIYPSINLLPQSAATAKSPMYRPRAAYAARPSNVDASGPAAVISTPCMRVKRAVSFVQSPPIQARYTSGRPPPRALPTSACPISCTRRQTKPAMMNSITHSASTRLVMQNARPRNARVSQSVGWMLTGTRNSVKCIIRTHSMLPAPGCASPQAAIPLIMTGKFLHCKSRFMLAECLRFV